MTNILKFFALLFLLCFMPIVAGTTAQAAAPRAAVSATTAQAALLQAASGHSNFANDRRNAEPSLLTPSTTTLTSSLNPAPVGVPVTFTATVTGSGGTPTGSVIFLSASSVQLAVVNLTNGKASFTPSSSILPLGSLSLTAVYSGDIAFLPSTSLNLTEVVEQAIDTVTGLLSSNSSAAFGAPITLSVNVTASGLIPTGLVTFLDGSTQIGTGTLTSGATSLAISTLSVGKHTLSAVFGGATGLLGSTSVSLTQTIIQATPLISITANANPIVFGQPLTLNITVLGVGGILPSGLITLTDGSTTLGNVTLNGSGVGSFVASTLGAGTHSITALIAADSNFLSALSSALTETINKAASTVNMITSPNPATAGQPITLSATVTGPGGTPVGSVNFMDGGTSLGTANLVNGVANLTTATLGQGTHTLTGAFGGTSNLLNGVSSGVSQLVNPSTANTASTTSLTVAPSPATFGQAVSLTVTVTGNGGTPTGSVTFVDGSTTIGTATLSGGAASFSATALGGGAHSLTAIYGGDNTFLTSTSAVIGETVDQAASVVVVTSSANPSTVGQAVTFSATVTGPGGTPTGSVTFKDGATVLGTGSLASGATSFTSTALAQGAHTITAAYGGSANLLTGVSTALAQVVNPNTATVASTTAVTVSPNPATFGQSLTFTVAVTGTGGTPTGTVTFQDGSTTIGTATLSGGAASFATAALGGGSHSFTATYSGDGTFKSSTSTTVTETISPAASTIAVVSSANPSIIDHAVTFTATVTGPGGTPTGSVTFKDGSTVLGTGTLTAGVASVTSTTLTQGTNTITATYSGSANLLSSVSTALSQVVNPSTATVASTTTMTVTPNPAVFGKPVTFTVTVTGTGGTPTGTVTFNDGSTTLGTVALANGTASFTTTLGGGSNSLTATYSGDGTFKSSTSTAVSETVTPASASVAVLAAPNPAVPGQPVTFTATVTGVGGTPTGSVTFKDGTTTIGTATLSGGAASFTIASLAAGNHSITASYSGDANFQGGVSSPITEDVTTGTSATALSSSLNPSIVGKSVTFTATVTGTGGTPAGSITFLNGSATLGSATLTGGVATISTSSLTAGTHIITAVYGGSGTFQGSVSPALSQSVNQSAATLASATVLISTPNPSTSGQLVTFTATVTGTGGTPTGSVTFEDGSMPIGTGALAAGKATFATAGLGSGIHLISALYSGDGTFLTSTSSALSQTINAATVSVGVYSFQSTLGVTDNAGSDNAHFHNPLAGAVDPANNHLFVADSANQRIQVVDTTTLQVVATIGVPGVAGADNTHFNLPGNMGFDTVTGRLFVADTGNQRVQIFDGQTFAFMGTVGAAGVTGADNNHFDSPVSARLNALTRQLYVADLGNSRVQVFDADTLGYITTLGTAGTSGTDNAHFNQPNDIDYNISTNQIMVSDGGNARVQMFDATSFAYNMTLGGANSADPTGNSTFALPDSVTFDPVSNLVLVADAGTNARVQVFDGMSFNYVMTVGTAGSKGTTNTEFVSPLGVTVDPRHAHVFVGDSANDRVQIFDIAPTPNFASVLPDSRSVLVGNPATIFATLINGGTTDLGNCQIALSVSAPPGLSLTYQTTDPATNRLVGTPNTPVSIAGNNGSQSFLINFQSDAPFDLPAMPIDFNCAGTAPAAVFTGVDTVDLLMSTTTVPDIIALSATPTDNGIVTVPQGGTGAFAVATVNIGIASSITVSLDTGIATLPVDLSICESNPTTGQCLAPPTPTVAVNYAAGATPTFSVFVQSTGPIPFSPADSRVFVRFEDSGGAIHGSTSVAVDTK
jgi:YVTN family beta-propeller protein